MDDITVARANGSGSFAVVADRWIVRRRRPNLSEHDLSENGLPVPYNDEDTCIFSICGVLRPVFTG